MNKNRMERTHHSLISEGVLEDEQTLTLVKPFWVFFVGNIGVGTWLIGVLLAGLGLNFTNAMTVILLSGVVGCALPAALAILGPSSQLSQMEVSRFSFGAVGKRFPAFLNWVGCIGWDSIVNILGSSALVSFTVFLGIPIPFWAALTILVVIQLVIGIYGHHLIQNTSQYTGAFLGLMFAILGIMAVHKTGIISSVETPQTLKAIFSGFILLVAYNAAGWTTYTADYTRYLPKSTSSLRIFGVIFGGLFLSFLAMTYFGYMTASTVTEQTPAGVMTALQGLSGKFAPLVLFVVAFNSIPVNAINDNSAAYSLISSGFRLSRPLCAIFGSVLGYIICLLASSSFVDAFENFLFLYAHWIASWSAILLLHWFFVRKKNQTTPPGIAPGCYIFLAVTVTTLVLFSANSLYTGILSAKMGGIDVGPYLGFILTGVIYYLVILKKNPREFRAS